MFVFNCLIEIRTMPRKVNYGLDRDDDYDVYEDYDYAYDEEYEPDLDENGM